MRNENIGFHFEVKGETFSPIAKEYFQDQKANLENEVNLFSFINLCVEGSVPQGERRSQKDTQTAAAGVLACNHCRAGQRGRKANSSLLENHPTSEPLEVNVKLQESCSELYHSLTTVTCGLTPHLALMDSGIDASAGHGLPWCHFNPVLQHAHQSSFLQCAADGMIKSCLSVCCTTSSPEQREIGDSCAFPGCGCWCQR